MAPKKKANAENASASAGTRPELLPEVMIDIHACDAPSLGGYGGGGSGPSARPTCTFENGVSVGGREICEAAPPAAPKASTNDATRSNGGATARLLAELVGEDVTLLDTSALRRNPQSAVHNKKTEDLERIQRLQAEVEASRLRVEALTRERDLLERRSREQETYIDDVKGAVLFNAALAQELDAAQDPESLARVKRKMNAFFTDRFVADFSYTAGKDKAAVNDAAAEGGLSSATVATSCSVEVDSCLICLIELSNDDRVCQLPCGHRCVHSKCFKTYLEAMFASGKSVMDLSCPVCRAPMIK
jgi:hypothetical protein